MMGQFISYFFIFSGLIWGAVLSLAHPFIVLGFFGIIIGLGYWQYCLDKAKKA